MLLCHLEATKEAREELKKLESLKKRPESYERLVSEVQRVEAEVRGRGIGE